ncbi:SH3 domain-containing protein [Thiohalocapsa sp. ML1]|jgi:hypothetical protein|uniref:SH3 domain-containing protein n=1 Tax=Thiohalocapsa sp. ML1 TaxID=1431688 RepID=UPI0009E67366|nr:SH3 domain-containing protein [Thiohalocapsa sp. ML1]
MRLRAIFLTVCLLCGTQAQAAGDMYIVIADALKVRSGPNTYSDVVTKLPYGDAVRVSSVVSDTTRIGGKSGKWVYITFGNGGSGYVFDAFLSLPNKVKSKGTRSFSAYRQGNKHFRNGRYYHAISSFSTAWDTATADLERMRAIGGLAQTAKTQGNIKLAKDYADHILKMDPGNKYALEIKGLGRSRSTYSWRSSEYCSNRAVKCLAMTWGPDVCSTAFGHYFKKEFGFGVNDVIGSPSCSYAINTALQEGFTEQDLQIAAVTGLLDEIGSAGLNHDSGFGQLIGYIGYGASLAIKFNVFDTCMRKCN